MTPRNKPLEKRPAAADDDDDDDGQARYRVQDCDPARADDTLQLAPPFAQTIEQFAQNFLTGNSALAKSANFLAGGLDEITIRAQRLNVIEEYSVPFGPSAAPPVLNRPPMENCFAMERGDERAMVFTVEQKRLLESCGFKQRCYVMYQPGGLLPFEPRPSRSAATLPAVRPVGATALAEPIELSPCSVVPGFSTAQSLCAIFERPFEEIVGGRTRVCSPMCRYPVGEGERKKMWKTHLEKTLNASEVDDALGKNLANFMKRLQQYWALTMLSEFDAASDAVYNKTALVNAATSAVKVRPSDWTTWAAAVAKIAAERMASSDLAR